MVKPITMSTALRRIRENQAVTEMSVQERFINHVNSRLATKESMRAHRCDESLGHFYQVCTDMEAAPSDCQAIDKAFREAGWAGVHVVYYRGRLSVTLYVNPLQQVSLGKPHYNGKQIACIA